MRPVVSSPALRHVAPPSTDRNIPQPIEMWLRMNDSPVPTHTTLGFDGATASAPIDDTGSRSKIGRQ